MMGCCFYIDKFNYEQYRRKEGALLIVRCKSGTKSEKDYLLTAVVTLFFELFRNLVRGIK